MYVSWYNIKQNINLEGINDAIDLRNFYLLVYLLTSSYRLFQTEKMLVTYVFFSFYFKALVELVAVYSVQKNVNEGHVRCIIVCTEDAWASAFA